MFTRRKFQITMGLTLVLAMLISVTAASAQEAALGGNVTVRDGAGSAVGSNNSIVFFALRVDPNPNFVDFLVTQTKKALHLELVNRSFTLFKGQGQGAFVLSLFLRCH